MERLTNSTNSIKEPTEWLVFIRKNTVVELSMGWVDPWVGSGLVEIFHFFGGLGWVHYSKSTENLKGLF